MIYKRSQNLKKKSIRNVVPKSRKNTGGSKKKLTNQLWSRLPTEQLLDLRMCDLGLSLAGYIVEGTKQGLIEDLIDELEAMDG